MKELMEEVHYWVRKRNHTLQRQYALKQAA